MRKLLDQALGREPEPMWMTVVGFFGCLCLPILLVLIAVAGGIKS